MMQKEFFTQFFSQNKSRLLKWKLSEIGKNSGRGVNFERNIFFFAVGG